MIHILAAVVILLAMGYLFTYVAGLVIAGTIMPMGIVLGAGFIGLAVMYLFIAIGDVMAERKKNNPDEFGDDELYKGRRF